MDLQFITHSNSRYDFVEGALLALKGGCRWIQLRMKGAEENEIVRVASILRPICKQYGATLIIDDCVFAVKRCMADGVHLGKNDMDPEAARCILGEGAIIGGTANTFDDVSILYQKGVDYIGLGPFRFTTTKKNLSPVLGIEGYKKIVKQCKGAGINLPIVAIGGITKNDIHHLMETGIAGIAISSGILSSNDPILETFEIMNFIKSSRNE